MQGWLGPYVLRTSGTSTAALGFSAGYFATDLTMLVLHYPHVSEKRILKRIGSLKEIIGWSGQDNSKIKLGILNSNCVPDLIFHKAMFPLLAFTHPPSPFLMFALQFGDTLVAAHHVAALASVAASALTGQGHAFTLLLLGTEATTPFVNLRWTLDKARLRSHPAYLINGITMAVSWLIVRILLLGLYFFPLSRRHAAEGHLVSYNNRVMCTPLPCMPSF